ncbi:MBL fold metallo-hydrolase [Clostridium oceanicum]|uniref:MBL fold metallo-hydrolase n=1 Tax=Clostridium oceanicum TaxID=1543 RepID=A0ABN1JDW5_9CLOT
MKITTVIENSLGKNKNLNNEHGLSFFIETENCNILFDTGKSGDFVFNAERLGVDLNSTDYLLLSHAHYDHCGGVRKFLESFNVRPEFYVSENFFSNGDKYHYSDGNQNLDFASEPGYRYIGTNFDEEYLKEKGMKINFINNGMTKLNDKVYVFTNFERTNDIEKANPNMKVKEGDSYKVDSFNDEIVMAFDTKKGLVVLLGCSHPGILNIIDTIAKRTGKSIYAVLGGTHLVEADEDRINKTIEHLNKMNIKLIGVSHCTGDKAVSMFKEKCDDFFVNCTGTVLEI